MFSFASTVQSFRLIAQNCWRSYLYKLVILYKPYPHPPPPPPQKKKIKFWKGRNFVTNKYFFLLKSQVHIFNIYSTIVQNFRLIAKNCGSSWLYKPHTVLAMTRKISKFEKAVILSKNNVLFFNKAGANFQCVCNKYAKFQTDC